MISKSAAVEAGVAFDHLLEPHVRIHHGLPGRTRLRLDPLRNRTDLLTALARRIAARERIFDVRESPWSGSLLIEHDVGLSAEALAGMVR